MRRQNKRKKQSARLLLFAAAMFVAWPAALICRAQTIRSNILFREAAAETNLNFHHFTGATGQFYLPEIMGAGGALFDYDNDGDLDIFLVQGAFLEENKRLSDAAFPPPPNWQPGHRLFRNELVPLKKLRFTDVTAQAGVGGTSYGMGTAVGDYDNDGDQDLYVTNFGANILYRNNGNGTFTEATREAGVEHARWSTSAAFVDYDGDADLDLFVANYVDFTVKSNKKCFTPTGEPDYCAPAAYRSLPSKLFRNEGGGKFSDATLSAGIGSAFGPALGIVAVDVNGDGLADFYVANDGAANLLWLNKGDGTFTENGLMAGAAYGADGVARAGMGVAAGDIDNDADEDLLITNLTKEGSTLFLNDNRGLFEDVSRAYNLNQLSFLSTGFGVGWFDYDNDGYLDLFAANGAVTLLPALRGKSYPFHQKNQLFHNEGERKAFRETTAEAGPALQLSEVSRGAAFGDVDNDGDVDVLVTNNNGPVRLLLNENQTNYHWLTIRLEAVQGNRYGIGARIEVLRKNMPPLWRTVRTNGSYLSASDVRTHFGLGPRAPLDSVIVHWPNKQKEIWNDVRPNTTVTLRQNTGKPISGERPSGLVPP